MNAKELLLPQRFDIIAAIASHLLGALAYLVYAVSQPVRPVDRLGILIVNANLNGRILDGSLGLE